MNSLFAYGTLMCGEIRHRVLKAAAPLLILPATTRGLLINIGPYPALLRGAHLVSGEYFEFEDLEGLLPRLDAIEGAEYSRESIEVRVEGLGIRKAWAYLWTGEESDGPRIESGDWRKR